MFINLTVGSNAQKNPRNFCLILVMQVFYWNWRWSQTASFVQVSKCTSFLCFAVMAFISFKSADFFLLFFLVLCAWKFWGKITLYTATTYADFPKKRSMQGTHTHSFACRHVSGHSHSKWHPTCYTPSPPKKKKNMQISFKFSNITNS